MPTPDDLKDKLNGGTTEAAPKKNFGTMLQAFMPEIQRALPAHMKANIDRYTRLAITQFKSNPKLAQCDPRGVFGSIILATQLGLELGVLGQAWLVPYFNGKTRQMECQLIPGWQGYMELLHRAGKATAWTGAVFEGDEFDYGYGDSPFIKHKPCGEDEPEKMTHVYAVGRVKGQEWPVIHVMTAAKCEKNRDRFNKVGARHYSYENWEMYCRKICLLQALKYLPRSVEMASVLSLDHAADSGAASPSLQEAIDGEFSFIEADDGAPPKNHEPATTSGAMTDAEKAAALRKEQQEGGT